MNHGRILALCLLFAGLAAVPASAADIFLERFRVGAYRDAAALAPDPRGWPRDLFPSPADGAVERSAVTAAVERAAGPDALPGARVIRAAGPEAAGLVRAWADKRLARADAAREVLAAWHEGRFAAAETGARALAAAVGSAEEAYVWTLRAEAAHERRTGVAAHPSRLWVATIGLGPYDAATGWAVWRARQEALGRPLLPAWIDERRSALWLAGLGEAGLQAADLDAAGFAPELKAALGAVALPRERLARHFGLYPDPPADTRLAALWARGRQRQEAFAAAATEALGAMTALPVSVRAELLRKAADRRITSLQWEAGLEDLERATDLAARVDSSWLRRLVRTECRRAEALARHRGRAEDALRLAALQGRLPETPDADPLLGRARTQVRAGEAASLGSLDVVCDRAVRDRVRDELWPVWARWGRGLCGDGYAWYRDALAALAAADTPTARREAAEAAVALCLKRTAGGRALLAWGLELDLEAAADGARPAAPSAVPALIVDAPAVRIHAALGLCLLAGDPRGQLACAYALPRDGLSWEENRRFLYPLPSRDAIVDLLTEAADPALALAVARNESLFDPAVRSRSGALGWMQIMPFHYPDGGVPDGVPAWRIPATSAGKGLALLEDSARRYGGDPYRTVAAYNAGSGAVARWDEQLGGTPDRATFLAWIGYPETHRYTEKVLIDREIYAHILGGYRREEPSAP